MSDVPETWIRLKPLGVPHAFSVWVHLGGEKTLAIDESGQIHLTGGWSGYRFKTWPAEQLLADGIVRIA